MMILPGTASRPVVCHPALSRNRANYAVNRTGGPYLDQMDEFGLLRLV